jgi:hypothetical protein
MPVHECQGYSSSRTDGGGVVLRNRNLLAEHSIPATQKAGVCQLKVSASWQGFVL